MPSQNHSSNMDQLIDKAKAFQPKDCDDLPNQPTEQYTLAACSSILRMVYLRLKQTVDLAPHTLQLLVRVFNRFSDPTLMSPANLKCLDQESDPATTMAFVLYNMGCIVDEFATKAHIKSSQLPAIPPSIIESLLSQMLQSKSLQSKYIGNSLHGLGCLAEHGLLKGSLDSQLFNALLKKLNDCQDIHAQSISNSLHGLVRLSEHRQLDGSLDGELLNALLGRLNGCHNIDVQAIGNSLHGLGRLHLLPPIVPQRATPASAPAPVFFSTTSSSQEVPGQGCSRPSTEDPGSSRKRKALPTQASESDREWKQASKTLSSQEAPGQRCPSSSKKPYLFKPPCKRIALATEAPKLDKEWEEASQNALFQAISSGNLAKLRELLELQAQPSVARSATRSCATSTNEARIHEQGSSARAILPMATHQNQAEQRVNQLLQRTPANVLCRLVRKSSHTYFTSLLEACSVHGRFVLATQQHLNGIIIHLPLGSLPRFITGLLNLQLYRDHHALLALLDALRIRFDKNPAEREAIVFEQKRLMARSLEFHSQSNHHLVVACLEEREQRITSNLTTTSRVPAVEQQAPLPTVPMPVRPSEVVVNTPALAPSVPLPAHPAESKPSVDSSYRYTDEDINALLHLRLKKSPEVQVLAATHLREDAPGNLRAVLEEAMQHQGNHVAPYTALVPIAVNEHWVGIKITIINKKIAKMTYFNSMETEGSPHKANILSLLKSAQLCAPDIVPDNDTHELMQTDSDACGPLLVENMRCNYYANYWLQEPAKPKASERLVLKIRKKHFDWLAEGNPSHFEKFKKQDSNRPPAVSTQLQLARQAFFNCNNCNNRNTIAKQSSTPSGASTALTK